ncbi:MAG: energy-coupling factor transporter transmembrane component T [Pseudomonadota bacterium]
MPPPAAGRQVRARMLICLVASLVVIWLKSPLALGWLAAWATALALATTPWRLLVKAYALAAGLFALSLGFGWLMAQWSPALGQSGWTVFLTPFLRVAVLLGLTLSVALGARPTDLLAALKGLRLPLFIHLPLVVMIRLVPSLISDLRQIADSLRLKGVRLNPLSLIVSPLLTTRLVFAPLVFRVLRSAEELAVAAELKGLGRAGRLTAWRGPRFRWRDALLLGLSLLILAGACWLEAGAPAVLAW